MSTDIKWLNLNDTAEIENATIMLMAMYRELQPEESSKNFAIYKKMMLDYIRDDYVLYVEDGKAVFIMHSENIPAFIDRQTWSMVVGYIKPRYRGGILLKAIVDYILDNFDGEIMGYAEANSRHNHSLMKNHTLLGYVYNIRRK